MDNEQFSKFLHRIMVVYLQSFPIEKREQAAYEWVTEYAQQMREVFCNEDKCTNFGGTE